jgi:hypothetical protein
MYHGSHHSQGYLHLLSGDIIPQVHKGTRSNFRSPLMNTILHVARRWSKYKAYLLVKLLFDVRLSYFLRAWKNLWHPGHINTGVHRLGHVFGECIHSRKPSLRFLPGSTP